MRIILVALSMMVAIAMAANTPIPSVSVSLRGKKYTLTDVTTVDDCQDQLESLSGVTKNLQGRLLFDGKRLESESVLADEGVPMDGSAVLNMVPTSSKKKKKKKSEPKQERTVEASGSSNPMADYLKSAGVDSNQLDEMMKSMGGGGAGGEGGMPNMEDSMKAMKEAMNSPLFQQMMSDPEKLEQSRQMILNNPMLKSMMGGMPGMESLLNDPDAWREAMQAAAELYKNMDSDTLMKSMMGGGGGAGLFDGNLDGNSAATAGLDELDEED